MVDNTILPVIIMIAGFFIGSFLGVVVDRGQFKKSFLKGRSVCDSCKRKLSVKDLVPVFSYLFLRRKCRYCKKKLSLYYPLVELITGVSFAIAYLFLIQPIPQVFLQWTYIFYYLLITALLIIIFFSDLKYGIIPNKIVLTTIAISLLFTVFLEKSLLLNHVYSALAAFAFFLFLFLFTKGKGMGFGDVKFAFLMGLILGFPGIVVAMYIAFLTGALVSIILILWKGKHFFRKTIPFGPFLAGATFVSLIWGDLIWQKILQVLF